MSVASRVFGTTAQERAAVRRSDGQAAIDYRVPAMAATIAMPPAQLWGFLIQMGRDRAGFYSWDRLDNGGRPSAREIHPEWQDLAAGGRILASPDGSVSFAVVEAAAGRSLVLRLPVRLPSGRPFDPARQQPRAFVDAIWTLTLTPAGAGATRLLSTVKIHGRPRWLYLPLHFAVVLPAHWIMQRKQFVELQRRAVARATADA